MEVDNKDDTADMEVDNKDDTADMEVDHGALAVVIKSQEDGSVKLTNPCRCTYAVTGPNPSYQAIFICRACNETHGKEDTFLCVCEACANHCHESLNHDEIDYLGMGKAYCDCAQLGSGGCKILDASQKEIEEWKYPVAFGGDSTALSTLSGNSNDAGITPPQYIMDAYSITGLSNNNIHMDDDTMDQNPACQHLVEQASGLIQHSKETFWLPATSSTVKREDWCDLEQMAWNIFRQHTTNYDLPIQETGGAEWWVQVKQQKQDGDDSEVILAEAVDLHYDKDETLAEKYGLGSFPTLSTVTYLTDHFHIITTSDNATLSHHPLNNPTVVFPRTYEKTITTM